MSANPSAAELRATFDEPAPLTVGIEEELMLLDESTLALAPRATEVLAGLDGDPRFKLELPAAQLEIVSAPLGSAAEAGAFLAAARDRLAAGAPAGMRFAAAGAHPFDAGDGVLNDGDRYQHTVSEYGRVARRQLVSGLQVHVAVRGAGRALAVYNALRGYLPELLALAANAPFYAGEDTGLASVRPKICELLPRQGVPPVIDSWEAFAADLEWGGRVGTVRDPRTWWWELRPHPLHGTLELRVPDAQVTVADATAVIAVVHALVASLAQRHDEGETLPAAPTWRVEENRWRALRNGPDGPFADLVSGETVPGRERLHRLIDELQPAATALGSGAQLESARRLVEEGGAARQRVVGRAEGAQELVRWLSERFLDPL